jgi:hypothetical protein
VTDSGGNTIEITDYCPRFLRFGRMFRPPVIMRRIRPISGRPIITVRIKPLMANGAVKPEVTRGSNHMRFVGPRNVIRVTTNAAITYVLEERSFRLGDDLWFVLGPDEAVPEDVREVGRNQLEATLDWWQTWVRGLSIPFEWQAGGDPLRDLARSCAITRRPAPSSPRLTDLDPRGARTRSATGTTAIAGSATRSS